VSIWVTICSFCKVSVERVNNRVFFLFFSAFSVPLSDTRSASVGKDSRIFKFLKLAINPSLSAVYLTCSEPGLIPKIAFGFTPFATASSTIEAALDKSS
jgi:hypothetical protein